MLDDDAYISKKQPDAECSVHVGGMGGSLGQVGPGYAYPRAGTWTPDCELAWHKTAGLRRERYDATCGADMGALRNGTGLLVIDKTRRESPLWQVLGILSIR